MIRSGLKLAFYLLFLGLSGGLKAQDDAGLWTSVSLQHKFTQQWAGAVSEQFRLFDNCSRVDQFFTDLSLEYNITKKLKASLNYRLISKNNETYYSTRHRFYLDLSYKLKIDPLVISLRERIQEQFRDIHSSETGKVPEWYSRTKLNVKFDLNRKYTPYLATEMFYVIDNAKETDRVIDRYRYEAGVDYEINLKHSINLFYLIQHSLVSPANDYIIGIGYTFTSF
ncbi:MAG TPA: DUF2490 domain-containing protein [Bacteroidia bacterium]|nr:DUF2490 domain-containing protein [Bacteroidia bacterium]